MKPEFYAILSSAAFTLFYLFSRVAVQYTSALSINLWSNGICALLLTLPLPFVVIPADLSVWPMVSFGLAGICSPALAALFIILGSRKIGVARTGSLGAGLGPLFSSSIAILVLEEEPNWRILTGTLFIVVGISALALEKGSWGSTWRFIGYPLLGAICLALAAIFRKVALQSIPAPLFGAVVQNWAGFIFLLILAWVLPGAEGFRWNSASFRYLLLAGVFVAGSLYAYFSALESGDVTIVTPLVHTWPLLVTLTSWMFIQRLEQVTPRTVIFAASVVAGGFFMVG